MDSYENEQNELEVATNTEDKPGLALASMVIGICAVAMTVACMPATLLFNMSFLDVGACCNGSIQGILSVLAFIFALVGKKKTSKKGMAIAGLILSIIAFVITAVLIVIVLIGDGISALFLLPEIIYTLL